MSKNAKRGKEGSGRRIAVVILPPLFTVPTTVRRCGRCGAIATIRWPKHGMAGRLSEFTMLPAQRWSNGLGIPSGLRNCGRENLTIWCAA